MFGIQERNQIMRRFLKLDRESRTAYLFLSPILVFFFIFYFLPIGMAFYQGLYSGMFGKSVFVGLKNYARIFNDEVVLTSLRSTLYFMVISGSVIFIISLGLAIILNENIRARTTFRSILFFPYMISLVIIGYAWSFILDQRNGILNYFLSFVGIPNIEWFSPELALLSIVIMFAWWLIGYCAMLFTAGMQSIPGEYYEACRLDGASTLDCLRFITIPLLRPIMMFVILMIILFSFQTFVLIFNTTGGGPSNATNLYIFHLYRVAFLHLNPGYASALTFLGMTIIIGMAIIIFKKMDIKFEY